MLLKYVYYASNNQYDKLINVEHKNTCIIVFVVGSSARFFGLGFFHGSAVYGPQISRLKGFSFLFRFRKVI